MKWRKVKLAERERELGGVHGVEGGGSARMWKVKERTKERSRTVSENKQFLKASKEGRERKEN